MASKFFLLTLIFLGHAAAIEASSSESVTASFDLNCDCSGEVLRCAPSLSRSDGVQFRSQAFAYRHENFSDCQLKKIELRKYEAQTYKLVGSDANAESYRLNFILTRSHDDTCEYVYSSGLMDGWKCKLETAINLRSDSREEPVAGKIVVLQSHEAYLMYPQDQPAWSAAMTLRQVNELIDQFTKRDAIFLPTK
jgi:hypothetical protein